MVERTSQPFQLNVQQDAQVQPLQLGRGKLEESDYTPSVASQALIGILGATEKLAGEAVQNQVQSKYLEGQRARMLGQSTSAVESDPLSRPFVNGGWQDQDYRMDQAQMASDMNLFIKDKGKAMSPKEFGEVLAARSQQYASKYNNLSANGQAQALAQQTKMEQGLIASHATAYANWSIEQGAKRFQAQGNQIMTDLARSADPSASPAERGSQIERAAMFYVDLMSTDKLPETKRTEIATEYLGAMVNADQRQVVQMLRDGGFLNTLSFDERKKLDTAIRESEARTEAKDSLTVVMQNAQVEGQAALGNLSADDAMAHVQRETMAGRMTYDQGKAFLMSWSKGLSNKDSMIQLAKAVNARDVNTMAALGFTPTEALEQMDKQYAANGEPLSTRLAAGVRAGIDLGTMPKSYGDTISMAVRAISAADEKTPVQPEYIDSLNQVMGIVQASSTTNPSAGAILLGSLPDDTKAAVAYALDQQKRGRPPVDSLREYALNREAFAQLSALEQATQTTKFKKQALDEVDSSFTSGFFGTIFNGATGRSNLDSNSGNLNSLQMEVTQEIQYMTRDRNNVGLSADAALELAVANVKSRSIPVGENGWFGTGDKRSTLVLPRGVTAQQVFGTSDVTRIGQLLNKDYPPTEGFSRGFRYNYGSNYYEKVDYDENGVVVGVPQRVNTQGMGQRIRDEQERIVAMASEAHFGAPVDVGGHKVRMDGGNTYGVPVSYVYNFRKELAGMEGFNLTVYKDANGLAVGLGHNVTGTNLKEGDVVTQAQAERWYRDDTDLALQQGGALAGELGVQNLDAQMALAGAVFQLGDSGLREFKDAAAAIKDRDFPAFEEAVRASKWNQQTPNRVDWFIKNMKPHFGTVRELPPLT